MSIRHQTNADANGVESIFWSGKLWRRFGIVLSERRKAISKPIKARSKAQHNSSDNFHGSLFTPNFHNTLFITPQSWVGNKQANPNSKLDNCRDSALCLSISFLEFRLGRNSVRSINNEASTKSLQDVNISIPSETQSGCFVKSLSMHYFIWIFPSQIKKKSAAFGNELLSGVANGGVELFGIDPLEIDSLYFLLAALASESRKTQQTPKQIKLNDKRKKYIFIYFNFVYE